MGRPFYPSGALSLIKEKDKHEKEKITPQGLGNL